MWFSKSKEATNTFQSFSIKDQLASSIIIENMEDLEVGDGFETTLMAINFPNYGGVGWLRELYNMKGNISITQHLTPTDTATAEENLNKAIKNLNTKLNEPRLKPSDKERYQKEREKLFAAVSNLIDNENNGFFRFGLSVRIHAETRPELVKLTHRVRTKMIGRQLSVFIPKGSMLDAYRTHLPFVKDFLDRYTAREMDAEAIATMLPMDSQNLNIRDGFVVGHEPKTGQLININPRTLHNHNMVIFGESGQGKSATMWELKMRFYKEGKRIISIDPENEYGQACRDAGGTTINVSNGTNDIINPFQVFYENTANAIDEYDKEIEEVTDVFTLHLQRLQEFFTLLVPGASEVTLSYADDCLGEIYKRMGISSETDFSKLAPTDYPILEDLFNDINEKMEKDSKFKDQLADFNIVLKKYVTGANRRIFNGHTNVNLDNDFIVFNIKELGEGTPMQAAAMSNTIHYIWNLITNNVRETYLFIDEMHVLNNPNTPLSMQLIRNIYKRIRKYGHSGAVSATQQTEDALKISSNGVNYGSAVVANSAIKILLPLDGMSLQVLKDVANMKFSEEEERILKARKNRKGEGLMIYAGEKVHIQFEPSPYEWELLGKKPTILKAR